jgi:hypothetical protein
MSDDCNFLGQRYWHLYLIYRPPSIFIYVIITKFTLVNFGYLKLKPGFVTTLSDNANENVALHKLTPHFTPKIKRYSPPLPLNAISYIVVEAISIWNIINIKVIIKYQSILNCIISTKESITKNKKNDFWIRCFLSLHK